MTYKGHKEEEATYEEYQKDVAEAKVNKPLNVASFLICNECYWLLSLTVHYYITKGNMRTIT